jgi:hypothetical protein
MRSSTDRSPRLSAGRLVFALLAIAAVVLAARDIIGQWQSFRAAGESLRFHWPSIIASSGIVFVAYAILIETWRRVVRAWASELPFRDAARIWFVSNLGRYIPGKVWQIAAMGAMAQEAGVSPLAASGSAIVVNLVNLLVGFGVVLASGAALFEQRAASVVLSVALLAGLALTPILLPWVARQAGRLFRRQIDIPRLPASAIWIACVGCLAAWLLYGAAFRLFVAGVLGSAPGPYGSYLAAFTGSYLLGYIALFSPGGLGVREGALVIALRRLGLGVVGGAGIIAVASRLWLTALEVVPGVLFLLAGAARRRRLPDVAE